MKIAKNSQSMMNSSANVQGGKKETKLSNEGKGNLNSSNSAENINKKQIQESIENLNEAVHAVHEDLQFELHDESERMMVKVMDLDKHKVIKEMPPKEMLDMLGKIKEMVGLIIDEKI
ncbi:flagellar protein FlaG [Orenia marismortui]|nr:flagellar protein FlaG [Orenia marismortui]